MRYEQRDKGWGRKESTCGTAAKGRRSWGTGRGLARRLQAGWSGPMRKSDE